MHEKGNFSGQSFHRRGFLGKTSLDEVALKVA